MYEFPAINLDGSPATLSAILEPISVLDTLKQKYQNSNNWDLVPMEDPTEYPADGIQRVWIKVN